MCEMDIVLIVVCLFWFICSFPLRLRRLLWLPWRSRHRQLVMIMCGPLVSSFPHLRMYMSALCCFHRWEELTTDRIFVDDHLPFLSLFWHSCFNHWTDFARHPRCWEVNSIWFAVCFDKIDCYWCDYEIVFVVHFSILSYLLFLWWDVWYLLLASLSLFYPLSLPYS